MNPISEDPMGGQAFLSGHSRQMSQSQRATAKSEAHSPPRRQTPQETQFAHEPNTLGHNTGS